MRKFLLAKLLLAILLGAMVNTAQAGQRIALVIGNADYATVSPLANPTNDAQLMARTLDAVGFEVTTLVDANQAEMKRAMLDFGRKLRAGVDASLFYYSGHGVQARGRNFLIPVDAIIADENELDIGAIDIDDFLAVMEDAPSKVNLVILDACRNNPFASSFRSATRGLSVVRAPSGTYVAYSTAPGSVAEDGTGENSVYTDALAKAILEPRVKVEETFKQVRRIVVEATHGEQVPWDNSSIVGDFYFRPASEGSTLPGPNTDSSAAEIAFWNSVERSNDLEDFKAYLGKFPNGTFAPLAERRIAALSQPSQDVEAGQPALAPMPRALIRIGVAGPMSGPYAAFGVQLQNGAQMAADDINDAGGIRGNKIVLEFGDDQATPNVGVSVANRFVDAGAKFVVGHFTSGVSIPASEVYFENRVLQITPSATNPVFTERGLWNAFRTCGRDDQQGGVAGRYIAKNFMGKKIAILHDKTPYGQGLADTTKRAMNAAGLAEVMYEGINFGDDDFSALVSEMKRAGVDVVYFGGLHTEAGKIVRQMAKARLKAQFISGDGIVSSEFATIAGRAAEGVLNTFGPDPRNNPAAWDVVKKFRDAGFEPEAYTLYSYAAVQVVAQAIEKTGSADDTRAVAATIKSSGPWKTVLGDLSYDEKGDRTTLDYVMYIWKKGADGNISYTEM